jgi:K+-transporting ATPase ATPase C chain
MTLRKDILASAIAMLMFTLLLGVVFPLAVEVIGQVAFPGNANGQKVYVDGRLVGSKLIGQNFADVVYKNGKPEMQNGNPVTAPDPRYFQTRPSGTTPADNPAATAFANYGPNSTITLAVIKSNIQSYIQLNGKYYPGGLTAAKVPVDAADTSASGIDPDISIANADIQAYRIAAVRHLSLPTVMRLVSKYTGGRGLGFVGERTVNVLELNLALNRLGGGTP